MPRHDPAHMQRMTDESAAARRAAKIAESIKTAPPLRPEQRALLHRLLDSVPEPAAQRKPRSEDGGDGSTSANPGGGKR